MRRASFFMKLKVSSILLLCLISSFIWAQGDRKKIVSDFNDSLFVEVNKISDSLQLGKEPEKNFCFYRETSPTFPGGDDMLIKFLKKNTIYPDSARLQGIEGTSFVRFIVESDGKISEAVIIKSSHPTLDAEALRVVHNMPDWTPGKINGIPTRMFFNIPFKFSLGKEGKQK